VGAAGVDDAVAEFAGSLDLACPHRAGVRAPSNQVVAGELGIGPHTVGKWRDRFIAERLAGLYDELRSGRPRTIADDVAELVAKTLATKPTAGTHWTVRAMATETPLSKSAVHRFFQLFGVQPHRTRSFKLSSDPFFVDKLRDVVGLYLNPPSRQGPCPARRREEPSPGAGAYPAHAADGRLCRGGHPRR
jgi:transposase